jgi:hypothetical protein
MTTSSGDAFAIAPKRKQYQVPPGLILDCNQRYSVPESAAILRQSVAKTWKDIREGKLQPIRDGARTYVRGAELIRRSTTSDAGPQAA